MPSVSGTDPSLANVTQWVGDGNMGGNNGGYSNGGGSSNHNSSSGNYSHGSGGGGSGNYTTVNSSNWKSMTRQQQAEWYNGRIRNSGTEFFSHPAGMAFGGIVAGGILAGTVLALEIPTVITDIVALFKAGQQVKTPNKVDDAAQQAKNWLGEDAQVITNKAGDKIVISRDGSLKMRFDINNSHGDSPHIHLERCIDGKWQDAIPRYHRIYPKP